MRQREVVEIKRLVRSGSYRVDYDALARCMVKDIFGPPLPRAAQPIDDEPS